MSNILWDNDTPINKIALRIRGVKDAKRIGAGAPVNANGEIANDNTAIGLTLQPALYPYKKPIDILTAGCVDEKKRFRESEVALTDDCKAALTNIRFNSIDGGLKEIITIKKEDFKQPKYTDEQGVTQLAPLYVYTIPNGVKLFPNVENMALKIKTDEKTFDASWNCNIRGCERVKGDVYWDSFENEGEQGFYNVDLQLFSAYVNILFGAETNIETEQLVITDGIEIRISEEGTISPVQSITIYEVKTANTEDKYNVANTLSERMLADKYNILECQKTDGFVLLENTEYSDTFTKEDFKELYCLLSQYGGNVLPDYSNSVISSVIAAYNNNMLYTIKRIYKIMSCSPVSLSPLNIYEREIEIQYSPLHDAIQIRSGYTNYIPDTTVEK